MNGSMSWFLTAGLVALVGCTSSGLSPRESTATMPRYLDAIYDLAPQGKKEEPARVTSGMRVSVAQAGEVTPPGEMVEAFRKEKGLFADVKTLHVSSNGYDVSYHYNGRGTAEDENTRRRAGQETVQRLMRMARDNGSTHLMLIGGNVDASRRSTAASVFDLTIVGAFIIPSSVIKTEGKAEAALVDLASQRLVQLSTVERNRTTIAASLNAEDEQRDISRRTRDDLIDLLTKKVIEDLRVKTAVALQQ